MSFFQGEPATLVLETIREAMGSLGGRFLLKILFRGLLTLIPASASMDGYLPFKIISLSSAET